MMVISSCCWVMSLGKWISSAATQWQFAPGVVQAGTYSDWRLDASSAALSLCVHRAAARSQTGAQAEDLLSLGGWKVLVFLARRSRAPAAWPWPASPAPRSGLAPAVCHSALQGQRGLALRHTCTPGCECVSMHVHAGCRWYPWPAAGGTNPISPRYRVLPTSPVSTYIMCSPPQHCGHLGLPCVRGHLGPSCAPWDGQQHPGPYPLDASGTPPPDVMATLSADTIRVLQWREAESPPPCGMSPHSPSRAQ